MENTDPQFNLTVELAKIAFDEFGETSEIRDTALAQLRERINKLPKNEDKITDTSDSNLIRFLRARKYDMDRVVEGTVQYQHFFNKHGDITNITKEELELCLEFLEVFREPNGRVICVMRPAYGIKKFTKELLKDNPRFMLRFNVWLFDTLSKDPQAQIAGLLIINSFQKFTFWDNLAMSSMAPMEDQLATFQFFQILGTRFKGAYIFEEPAFMSWIWFFVKPFMSEKIKSRFFLCGPKYEIIRNTVNDLSILPDYLGGTLTEGYPKWLQGQIALFK